MSGKQKLVFDPSLATEAANIPDKGTRHRALAIGGARNELIAVGELIQRARTAERDLSTRDFESSFLPGTAQYARGTLDDYTAAYGELASRGYGKCVTVTFFESGETRTYRVAQANVTVVDGVDHQIDVINRLAPVAQFLVSAQIGDVLSFPMHGEAEVIAVELVSDWREGPQDIGQLTCLWSDANEGASTIKIQQCRESVANFDPTSSAYVEAAKKPQETVVSGVFSLSHEFYTQTSRAQEELIRRHGRGVLWVEGVAGSGKTSVGLGLLKALHDRRLFKEGEEGHDSFFTVQSNMLAVVLNPQLVGYLRETCRQLHLGDVPVQDYGEVRRRLQRHFSKALALGGGEGSKKRFKLDQSIASRPTMAVVRDIEGAIFDVWIEDIRTRVKRVVDDAVTDFPSVRLQVKPGPRELIDLNGLVSGWLREWSAQLFVQLDGRRNGTSGFAADRLSTFLEDQYQQAVSPFREAARWYMYDGVWSTRPRRHQSDAEIIDLPLTPFERERFLNEADFQHLVSARERLFERLVTALRLSRESAPQLVSWYESALTVLAEKSKKYLRPLQRLRDGLLAGGDVDVLLAILMMAVRGYRDSSKRSLFGIRAIEHSSIVFVDEVQDFSEIQLLTLSMLADPERSAMVVVGDQCQQLTDGGVADVEKCFPAHGHLVPVFLDRNFRQTENLGAFSFDIRKRVGGRVPEQHPKWIATSGELQFRKHEDSAAMVNALLDMLLESRDSLTTTVIAPTPERAKELYERLLPKLEENFVEADLTLDGRDLTRVDVIHFTYPLPAKGLEFQAVFVPYWEEFDLSPGQSGDGAYVAVSRAKSTLTLLTGAPTSQFPFAGQ
ncbi:MAG: hypothetical protein ACT4PZ_13865 [Panacagrimonas sp.]